MKHTLEKIGVLSFISCLYLTSCGGTESVEANKEYAITYQKSEHYVISNLPEKAKEGDLINFRVESTSVFYTIEGVSANGENVSFSGGNYSFLMPANDVAINVLLSDIAEFDNPDDNLSWPSSTPTTISVASDEDKNTSWDVTQDLALDFGKISSNSMITSIDETIETSNPDVIPTDALEFVPVTASASNVILGGTLKIDLKKVNPGSTYLYIDLKPNNNKIGTLIKKIDVVPYGDIQLETMEVTLNVTNNSDYRSDQLFFNLRDQEYVYGSNTDEIVTLYYKDFENSKTTFSYIKGHTYYVSCGIIKDDGKPTGESLPILDWVGEGSSTTGYNQFEDGVLSLIDAGVEAELTITD